VGAADTNPSGEGSAKQYVIFEGERTRSGRDPFVAWPAYRGRDQRLTLGADRGIDALAARSFPMRGARPRQFADMIAPVHCRRPARRFQFAGRRYYRGMRTTPVRAT